MRHSATLWAFLATCLCTPAAGAYTVRTTDGGLPLHWAVPVVPFQVDRSLAAVGGVADVSRTVAESFAGWGELPGSPFFFQGDPRPIGDCEPEPWDGVTDIKLLGEDWRHDPMFAGVTIVTYEPTTGEITDADILLNGAERDFAFGQGARTYDVGNVLTHELGHLLGLGHSEDPEATMFALSRPGETAKRSLSDDDVAGFEELYGAGVAPAAMATCRAVPGAPSGTCLPPALALLLVVLFACACRSRRAALRRSLAAAVGLFALAGAASAGWSAVGRTLPVEELARRADVVFRGTVVARDARWEGRLIVTDVTLEVDECWAGRCGTHHEVVTELGGEVDGVGMLAPEPTALPVGAEAVVFARDVRGLRLLVGGAQAVFRIGLGTTAVRRLLDSLADRPWPEPMERIERIELSTLRSVVRSRTSGP